MVKYVYVDVLFATNLAVNYLLLLAAGKLIGKSVSVRRLLIASVAGAVYATSAVFLRLSAAYSLPARIAFGLFMVAISFPGQRPQSFAIAAAAFYLCSAIVAGTAMALQGYSVSILSHAPGEPSGGDVHWWVMVGSLAVLAAFPVMARAGGFQPGRPLPLLGFELEVAGRRLGLTGLVDTGNNLRDPVTGLPVVVVDWEPLRRIMPRDVASFFTSTWDRVPEHLSRTPMGRRLRLVPYESVAGRRGILPAFKPDHIVILEKDGNRITRDAIVGVFKERLSPSGQYQALLHPDLLSL